MSKAWSETRALGLHARGAFEAVVVRFFNTSGPRQTAASGMVLPRFVEAALAGRPLVVHGDGRQTRCFTHVADAVEACARLLRVEGVAGRPYNVGAREEVAIGALAERVRAQLASASGVELRPHADLFGDGFADPRRRVPDTARLAAATGFEPGRPLADLVADLAAERRAALAAV